MQSPNAEYRFTGLFQAPWSASPPSLVLRSSLLLCSYPECCPRIYLRVAKPAYSRPRLPQLAKRRLNFLFPRMSSSFLHSISILFFTRSDDNCLCTDLGFANSFGTCLGLSCSPADAETAINSFYSSCEGAFVHPLSHWEASKCVRNIGFLDPNPPVVSGG